jgi:hypothetical protein
MGFVLSVTIRSSMSITHHLHILTSTSLNFLGKKDTDFLFIFLYWTLSKFVMLVAIWNSTSLAHVTVKCGTSLDHVTVKCGTALAHVTEMWNITGSCDCEMWNNTGSCDWNVEQHWFMWLWNVEQHWLMWLWNVEQQWKHLSFSLFLNVVLGSLSCSYPFLTALVV